MPPSFRRHSLSSSSEGAQRHFDPNVRGEAAAVASFPVACRYLGALVTIAFENDSTVTSINVFTVTQANQQRFIDLLTRATDGFVNRAPGFVSATPSNAVLQIRNLPINHTKER